MPIRQEVTQSQLPTLINNLRNHPIYGSMYQNMDDWEVYQAARESFKDADFAEAPEEWKEAHVQRLIKENVGRDSLASDKQANIPTEDFNQGRWRADWIPKWMGREAISYGLNNSITGLASHIISGEAPFELEEGFDPADMSMLENAVGFAAGMAFDFYLFTNPLSLGSSLAVKLAGRAATEQAAKQMTKHFFGKALSAKIKKEGVEEGFEGLTKNGIRNAFKKGDSALDAKDIIVANSRIKNKAMVESLYDDAVKASTEYVEKSVPGIRWINEGMVVSKTGYGLKAGDRLLPKPLLREVFHGMGLQGAKALGAYSGVLEAETQIRDQLMKEHGPKGPNAYDRWKETGFFDDILKPLDPQKILYSAAHGFLGGYVASGLSGIRFMGRAGAFEKGADKWVKNNIPVAKDKLYKGLSADAGWIFGEGLGFTVAGRVTDSAAKALGMDVPEHSFGETLLQNMITIGVLKKAHQGWRKSWEQLERPVGELKSWLDKKAVDLVTRRKALTDGLEGDNPNDAAIKELINKDTKEMTVEIANKIRKLQDAHNEFKRISKRLDKNKANDIDLERVRAAQKELIKLRDEMGEDGSVPPDVFKEVQKDLKKLSRNWETIDKDIQGQLKRKGAVDVKKKKLAKKKKVEDAEAKKALKRRKKLDEKKQPEKKSTKDDATKTALEEVLIEHGLIKVEKSPAESAKSQKKWEQGEKNTKILARIRNAIKTAGRLFKDPKKKGKFLYQAENEKIMWDMIDAAMTDLAGKGNKAYAKDIQKSFPGYLRQIMKAHGKPLTKATVKELNALFQDLVDGVLAGRKEAYSLQQGNKIRNLINILNRNKGILGLGPNQKLAFPIKSKGISFPKRTSYVPTTKDVDKGIERVGKVVSEGESPKERPTDKIKDTENVGYVGSPTAGQPHTRTNSAVIAIVHYLHGMLGKRRVALTWDNENYKLWEGGSKDTQLPILMKDVKFSKGKDGTRKATVTLIDKTTDKGEIIHHVVVYESKDGMHGVLPYDPYTVIREQHTRRKAEGAGKEEPLLTYWDVKDGTRDIPLQSEHVTNISKRYYLPKKKGATAHKTRNQWIQIAREINKKVGSIGNSLVDFVNEHMLAHDKTGMIDVYSTKQKAEITSLKHEALMEIYDLYSRKQLDKESFKQVIENYERIFKEKVDTKGFEGEHKNELWWHKDDPFKTTYSAQADAQKIGLTQHRTASKTELADQVAREIKKNTGLSIEYMNSKDKGEFIDGIIRLTEGKADLTTFFHENVHRLEKFVRKSADKKLIKIWEKGERTVQQWAIKNDKAGWLRFKDAYKTDKKAANEYLTQLSAEWSLERSQATGAGAKMRVWFKQLVSRIKTLMGIHNPKDVARIFGSIAEKGFSTKGTVLKGREYSKVTKDDLADKAQVDELTKALRNTGADEKTLFINMVKRLKLTDVGEASQLTQAEYSAMRNLLESIDIVPEGKFQRNKTWNTARATARLVNIDRGITVDTERGLKALLGIKDESFVNASVKQINQYIKAVEEHSSVHYGPEVARDFDIQTAEQAVQLGKDDSRIAKFITKQARLLFPVDTVLRKLGADRLANDILDHYQFEIHLKGEADFRIGNALGYLKKEYGHGVTDKNRKMLDEYMPFVMDPSLIEGAKISLEGETFIKRALTDTKSVEHKAFLEIQKMTDFFWDTHMKIGKANIKNPRLLDQWQKANNKKFVKNYFTRVLTEEAKDYFDRPENKEKMIGKVLNNLIDDVVKDRNNKIDKLTAKFKDSQSQKAKKEIRKSIRTLEKERDAILEAAANREGDGYQRLYDTAQRELNDLIFRKNETLSNVYLLERGSRLDNFMKNKDTGKEFQVWESNFSKVMGRYVEVMSKYLATSTYFPSYVKDFRHKYTDEKYFQSKLDVFKEHGGVAGAYVDKAFKMRLGLDQRDMSGDYWKDITTRAGALSAVFGLSSPFSGLKNMVISVTNTIGMFNTGHFLRGMALMMSPQGRQGREIVRRIGGPQTGAKELELGGTFGDWWLRKISWMKPTEVANRFYSAWAGLFLAEEMVGRLQGSTFTLFGKKSSSDRIKAHMKDFWHLTEEQINFLQINGLDRGEFGLEYGPRGDKAAAIKTEIRNKVLHYSHIKTQGATAEPFLPLWAQNRYAKSLTLFYRMAYGGTYNVNKYIIKPAMTKGDILPAVQYVFAGHLLGGALWGLLEAVIGTTPPKKNEEFWSRLMMNLSKAETLGLMGFVFSPYDKVLSSDSIMQPAIFRNVEQSSILVYNLLGPALSPVYKALGLGPWVETNNIKEISTRLRNITPFAQHLLKGYEHRTNPYKTKVNRIKTFRKAYIKQSGFWEKEQIYNKLEFKASPNTAYYNLIKEAFLSNDLESAAKYFWATKLYLWDNYRELDGRENKLAKETRLLTNNALDNVMRHINPLNFSNEYGRSKISKRKEFLNYLSEKERNTALDVEKTYYFKRRQLNKLIDEYQNKYIGIWNNGYMLDMLPYPPRVKGPLGLGRMRTSEEKKLRKRKSLAATGI